MKKRADVIIVGTGAAGLFCALHLPKDKQVKLITKSAADQSDSFLAQGGICVLKNEDDYDSFFDDTMKAGHYENDADSVHTMISESPEIIRDLIACGVTFEREEGRLVYTMEGAHSVPRILYHEDLTGKEITGKLLAEARKRENISIQEDTTMVDLVCSGDACTGILTADKDGAISLWEADAVVLATGGLGGLYEHSTNFRHLTGDAIAIALKHQIDVENLDYVQIHPTTLYSTKPGRRFLISESVRGEGAVLYNRRMERFVDELLPRDVLTEAIRRQMKADRRDFVWLSMQHMGKEAIQKRFPNIYRHCLTEGFDVTEECIPVTPAQHYLMGGIKVDLDSATSMERLYAIGETSCNRVHGANRLASNSLLESLVFAKRAAKHITDQAAPSGASLPEVDFSDYSDLVQLQETYKRLVINEIEGNSDNERLCNAEAEY